MSSSTSVRDDGSSTVASGLVVFAAVMLLISGSLSILRGIMGIVEDDVFVRTPNYVFQFDLTSWGWIHLVLGVLAVGVGLGLFRLAFWARILGVALAALLIIANFLSIPYYPFWSLTVMAVCGFVIWALCVSGRDDGSRTT
ncbi:MULTISPECIES: hypothetical protein [unclassified Kitasatospora]|uniref:DUF7144 family membrane protein n=1 Tax=unclassified Kitasatospora TaxID=2633591 RepID=UPI00070F2DAF|nr:MULTISPECIES: hypothetical protein [unclassified Kitasatospora]KQV17119.1 hypothetical protein ASC99_26245 [Kitasatospora sp. Root107]KRB70034.1 hypothetical protein ASE03_25615 [Kitasatospora sp. Root187]